MNRQLWEILAEERIGSHELAEGDRFLSDRHCVVDTERVEDRGQKHVLSNERKLAVPLHKRLGVLERLVDFSERNDLVHGVADHDQDESRHGNDQIPQFTLVEHDEEASI